MFGQATRDLAYFATQLRELRRRLGLTQEDPSLMSGVSTRTIEKLESGRRSPAEQTPRRHCGGLKIDRSYIAKRSADATERRRAAAPIPRGLEVALVQLSDGWGLPEDEIPKLDA